MIKICLIRHGETDWNANGIIQGITNTDLNEKGKNQAVQCAKFLSKERWDLLVTSPLIRAMNTANIIANNLHINIQVMEEFAEKHYGNAVGSSLRSQTVYADAGEQFLVFKKRVLTGFERIKGRYSNQKILLVAHGDVIQVILTTLFHSNEYNITVNNASVSEIEFNNGKWTLKYFNKTNYYI